MPPTTTSVSFYLNGDAVTVENPSPELLLIDYLRSPEVGLAGPKKACGQGGCGACTVILSNWNTVKEEVEHTAVNSCLRPVCALGGLVVTTIEGTGAARRPNPANLLHALSGAFGIAAVGTPQPLAFIEATRRSQAKRNSVLKSVARAEKQTAPTVDLTADPSPHPTDKSHQGMNPVAHRLAVNNGSQCGYCSVGFVMNMSEFILNNPLATKQEIEDIFDGNICRCTGYRPILTAMKTFASDWTLQDETERMKCIEEDGNTEHQEPGPIEIPFPDEAKSPQQPYMSAGTGRAWYAPLTVAELAEILRHNHGKKIRLVYSNTSFGIYKTEYEETEVYVDLRFLPDLNVEAGVVGDVFRTGASTTYSDLITALGSPADTSVMGAVKFMARRTAGRIVRNAATIAGNTMLVLHHIAKGTGEFFPSDLATTLTAVGAVVHFIDLTAPFDSAILSLTLEELIGKVNDDPSFSSNILLTSYEIPLGAECDVVLAQKVALRDVNAHSIVNITSALSLGTDLTVNDVKLVLGGIAPFPWRARNTELAMRGKKLRYEDATGLCAILAKEVAATLELYKDKMSEAPYEGFSNEYRVDLATGFLYKAIVNALTGRGELPADVVSSGEITWGKWGISNGLQTYSKAQSFKAPVALPYIKTTAMYQVSGQLHYTQELAVPPRTLNAAFVQSSKALANYHFVVPGKAKQSANQETVFEQLRRHLVDYAPSFVDLITYRNVNTDDGAINLQGMGLDQPIFAIDTVMYVGQSIALVLAKTEQEAIRIAAYVTKHCVGYTAVDPSVWCPPFNEPIIGLEKAIAAGSVFPDAPSTASYVAHVWKITRPGSNFDWVSTKDPLDREVVERLAIVDGAQCVVVENAQLNGGQAHFYMETQACIAEPADMKRIIIRPSTQSPMEMHQTTAMALGVHYHQVEVHVPPVGGAFGGKTEQARFVTGATAVAAHSSKLPVRLAMPRDEDTLMIGKRHAYYGQYQVAIDLGLSRAADKGVMRGFQTKMWGDGGAYYDCSFIVSNCIQLRADNAYKVANFENQIDVCRTNTAPSTAFRAFGDVQGKNIIENAVDDAAFSIGMTAEEVRERNFYDRGDVTPFGQALSYCYMKQVWQFLKTTCNFEGKLAAVTDFNTKNKWRKRGISMIPVKYGSGYNFLQLEQSAALIAINSADGTMVVHQSGVEMGQGLLTQAQQVVAYVLNVPMEFVQVEAPKTNITPNPTSSGASTGTPYSCEVVKQTAQELRSRLTEFGYRMLKDMGNDWCKGQGIDFWNYPEGWAKQVMVFGQKKLVWQNVVGMAYSHRVSLVQAFTAKIRGGTVPVPAMTFKPMSDQPVIPGIKVDTTATLGGGVDSFTGFTYSAACSVVEVDIITGEVKIISSDIVYDMGWSMNPAIDIGQVEGAFIQGVGYLLTENLVYEPSGEDEGRLNSSNTWRYKPPATTTIPLEMNVHLFPRDDKSVAGIPEDPNEIFSAKEVGEPPLVLANSVFFAVKGAVRASRVERGLSGLFRMDAPATVQEVRRSCEVSL